MLSDCVCMLYHSHAVATSTSIHRQQLYVTNCVPQGRLSNLISRSTEERRESDKNVEEEMDER
jgi:hypothetical protein